MLSYRHSFHAGNHADVLKHIVQSLILQSLTQKEKPFVYHDTHAGVGRYDLNHEWSEKTGEYKQGIERLWLQWIDGELSEGLLKDYQQAVQALNDDSFLSKSNENKSNLQYYPGSPRVARSMLRAQDRMVLTELHPSDFPLLQQEFHRDRQVSIHQKDGFEHLKATLPPKERRGLVLIDPPYELAKEYYDVIRAIGESYKRWSTGIYAIWYPVVQRHTIDDMIDGLKALDIRKILQIELGVSADSNERGMTASGMIVINPPWKLESQMQELLPKLQGIIAPTTGHFKVEWIVPE